MKLTKPLTIAIAAVVLIGGMAAVGAASPADQAPETASDAYQKNVPTDVDNDNSADAEANENADTVGPSDGLPDQVPDHVSQIHETISSYLDGSIDSLGNALSNLLDGGQGPASNGNEATAGAEGA